MERQTVAKAQKSAPASNHAQRQTVASPSSRPVMLDLQRSIGNQALQRLIDSPYIQRRVRGDISQAPASSDGSVGRVMRSASGAARLVQRKCACEGEQECAGCERKKEPLQRKAKGAGEQGSFPASLRAVMRSNSEAPLA